MTRRILLAAGASFLALALLGLGGAWAIDLFLGRDVRFIVPHAPEVVELQRTLWFEGDPVPDLYGIPAGETVRIVAPDAARLLTPSEDPSLTLMRVDKEKGENPLQVKTVWFAAQWGAAGLGLAGALLLLWALALRRRPVQATGTVAGTPAAPSSQSSGS